MHNVRAFDHLLIKTRGTEGGKTVNESQWIIRAALYLDVFVDVKLYVSNTYNSAHQSSSSAHCLTLSR
jgi:hypothetical protein